MCTSFSESGKPCNFDGCEAYKLLRAALTAAQLRRGDVELENTRLREALLPLLAHADAHDYAPPLKFSIQQCRDIKEKVNGI